MNYSPWADLASRTDITFGITRLPDGHGWWLPIHRAIVLDDRLGFAARRSTLAHELVHADRGDTHTCNERVNLRQEQHADLVASIRLITVEALVDALLWSQDEHEVAEQLRVDVATVRVRLANLTTAEANAIERGLIDAERGMA